MPEDGRSCHGEESRTSTRARQDGEQVPLSTEGLPKHTAENSTHHGDRICKKPPNTFRFVSGNIDSFPMGKKDEKNDRLAHFCHEHDVDFAAITEPNKCWGKMATDDRLAERFHGVWENLHTSIAYNKMNPHATAHQVGGAVGLSFDQAAHRVDSVGGGRGHDPTGLGRWTWTKFRGKGQVCLRAMVVYVPCVSTGPLTVWSQHMAYFNGLNDTEWAANPNPRERLFSDLGKSINEWIAAGDQLLIMGDWNVDVREHHLTDFFEPHGIREVLLEKHGQNAPPTCNMGSSPIDGIWATSSL